MQTGLCLNQCSVLDLSLGCDHNMTANTNSFISYHKNVVEKNILLLLPSTKAE